MHTIGITFQLECCEKCLIRDHGRMGQMCLPSFPILASFLTLKIFATLSFYINVTAC